MRIFLFRKNNELGFTLLECILAVGILSVVLAGLVGLQSSVVFVSQNSMDKLKAVWAMRQVSSQIDYLIEKGGFSLVPENAVITWPADNRFTVTLTRKELKDVKLSQFFITAIKAYNMVNGNSTLNVDAAMGPISQLLDSAPLSPSVNTSTGMSIVPKANQTNFINLFINVNWTAGSLKREFNSGLFLIDNAALATIKLPNLTKDNSNASQLGGKQ